jgi:hypothetical protein
MSRLVMNLDELEYTEFGKGVDFNAERASISCDSSGAGSRHLATADRNRQV